MVSTTNTDVLKVFVKEGNALGLWHIKDVEAEVLAGELKILPLSENILVPIDFILNKNAGIIEPLFQDIMDHIRQQLSVPSGICSYVWYIILRP